MNLQKLFEAQAVLDADIEKHHPVQDGEDRLSKKILALLVELGECANEWRGFKFWSNDQEPRIHVGIPKSYWFEGFLVVPVEPTKSQIYEYRNKLLEEYVDCLHFILSIGNDLKITSNENLMKCIHFTAYEARIETLFIESSSFLLNFCGERIRPRYARTLQSILSLGATLGFTWEQIEQAYFDKNKINHHRQETGY